MEEKRKQIAEDADLFCVSDANLKWLADEIDTWKDDDPRLDLLIYDESSRMKDNSSTTAKLMRRICKRFKIIWLFTGTPRPNSGTEYFVPMCVVSRHKLWGKNFDKWRRRFFFPTDFEQRNWEPFTHLVDEMNRDVAKYSFKVPMSEVPRPASDPIILWSGA